MYIFIVPDTFQLVVKIDMRRRGMNDNPGMDWKGMILRIYFPGEILNNVKFSNMLCHMKFLDNKLWLASVHHLIFFHFVFLKIKSLKLIE